MVIPAVRAQRDGDVLAPTCSCGAVISLSPTESSTVPTQYRSKWRNSGHGTFVAQRTWETL